MFDGDRHEALKLAQASSYPSALTTLIGQARTHLAEAEALLQHQSDLGDAVRRNRFEDRRLEDVIDLLAAIWRAQERHLQEPLPGVGVDTTTLVREWLTWLARREGSMAPLYWRALLLIAYDTSERADVAYQDLVETLRAELAREAKAVFADSNGMRGG